MKRFDFKFLELAFAMLLLSMTPEKRKDLKDGDHVWDRLTKKRGWDFISIMFWVPCSPTGCMSVLVPQVCAHQRRFKFGFLPRL